MVGRINIPKNKINLNNQEVDVAIMPRKEVLLIG